MKDNEAFTAKDRLKSFVFAFRGLAHVARTQHNMWIHLCVTAAVLIAAVLLHVGKSDWLWLIVSIVIVFFAEIINSAFEFLCDAASPDQNPAVEKAKDIAAGAVLVAACGAILIGLLVFWPYL